MQSTTIRNSTFAALVAASAFACGDDSSTPLPGNDSGLGSDVPVGGDAGQDTGPVVPPPGEDLVLVYTLESTFDEFAPVEVWVVDSDCRADNSDLCDPGSCEPVQIMPRSADEPLCNNGCQFTNDLSHIVFLDPDDPRTLRTAPLGPDYQLTADSTVIASNVVDVDVAGSVAAYRVDGDIHAYDLNTQGDRVLGTVTANGGFQLSSDGTQLFLNDVISLTAMQTSVIPTNGGAALPVHKFVAGEEQGTGSFFSGREPMAVSPSGDRLAVITDSRTSGPICASSNDCTEPGYSCLTTAAPPRCVRQELVLEVINLDETDLLRTRCSADVDCGTDHFCDLSAVDADGLGECLPGRFLLGPAGPSACNQLTLGEYSGAGSGLAWREDRTVLAMLTQDCVRGNIPVTDVVALNLDGAAFEPIVENPGLDHGQCYDEVEGCFDPADCNVEIDNIVVSPSGRTVAVLADSVSTPLKSELYLADSYGQTGLEMLTRSIDYDVISVSVHDLGQ